MGVQRHNDDVLEGAIIQLASQYGRYGLSPDHGSVVRSGLGGGQGPGTADLASGRIESAAKAEAARPVMAKDGSCVRLRPEHENHVWSYDFVSALTHDSRTLRLLTQQGERELLKGHGLVGEWLSLVEHLVRDTVEIH